MFISRSADLLTPPCSYAIQYLAPKSPSGTVDVISHSQGGLNVQWALSKPSCHPLLSGKPTSTLPLAYWPSIQPLVHSFTALAADFHGTDEGMLACNAAKLGTCAPSVWQQTAGSNYLAASNCMSKGGGGHALVGTTSIFTVRTLPRSRSDHS